MKNLTEIISKLQTDKVKARQEALVLLEEAFISSDALIDTLGTKTREWLAVFRALFTAVVLEKAVCTKKGIDNATSISLSRLEKAGAILRHVTRRCVPQLGNKVVKELLNHLMGTMVHRGRLVSSLSLNYVKTILGICSHKPHLEHLTTDMWISLCSLSFAAILGDNLSEPRGFGDEEFDPTDVEIEMDVDVDQVGSYDEELPGTRKRRRSDSLSIPPGPSSGYHPATSHTASPEQIDFMNLLVVLLRSPYAPYTLPGVSQKILYRLHRFFFKFSSWGNAHQAAIVATNIVLDQVELNLKKSVTKFALKMWPLLLSHWAFTKKSKSAKEEITLALIKLLPFITLPEVVEVTKNHVRERVDELYASLEDDLRHPSGFEGLSLDSLRLCLRDQKAKKEVFEADTFRSGFAFASAQALSWATLELHADCVKALHVYSERFGSPVKRRKIETPLHDILACTKNTLLPSKIRSHQLQVLLFVIDRHWAIFHESLQEEIFSALLEVLATEDPIVQSWSFLCLAAIAFNKNTVVGISIDWGTMWSHSVRRTSAVNVCRTASHAAHALLSCQRLPVHYVLADIESFANDLVVQGPTFPYDSVCAFLCDCLRVASQDMRLHRLQLPDKVLSWISENWNMAGATRSTMPAHTVGDVLGIFEATCGFSKTSDIPCRPALPDCVIVEAFIERHRTSDFREYILHSTLPPFRPCASPPLPSATENNLRSDSTRLAAPTPREIKVSSILYRSLDLLCSEWQNIKDLLLDSKPERIRRSLDTAVIALCFETSLMRNGSQCTRRVVQLACKLVEIITPCLDLPRWNQHERALILMGLEPLVFEDDVRLEDDPWELMPGPVVGSGLKRDTLVRLAGVPSANASIPLSSRKELQTLLWQAADVQDTFEGVMKALRDVLKLLSNSAPFQGATPSIDPDEGFTPATIVSDTRLQDFRRVRQLCIEVCMSFLSAAPILQSGRFNATRDKELTEFLLNCEPPAFLDLTPEFFQQVRRKKFHVSVSTAEKFKDRIYDLLTDSYDFARGVATQILALQFLHGTSHVWMQPTLTGSEFADGIRLLNAWFCSMILEGNLRSWRTRDRLICFLDHHVSIDPQETFWISGINSDNGEGILFDGKNRPSTILTKMADDDDVRVRFRAAVANARLLSTTDITHGNPMVIYERFKQELSNLTDNWEHMLTRFVHLGNAMIASSAVRRGPYWHLLEVSLYSSAYNDSVGAVVSAVADRLGLPDLRTLSETYISQLIESVIISDKDFFAFPPSLLGYDDRRQCAHATFPLLAPVILTAGESLKKGTVRWRLFEDHCHKSQKTVSEGLYECFADIVGTRIVQWIDGIQDDGQDLPPELSQSLQEELYQLGIETDRGVEPTTLVREHLDRIVFAMLRTVGDQDYSANGDIVSALKRSGRSERATPIFLGLTIYRKPTDFRMHSPRLPAFRALTVLRSLEWLARGINDVFSAPVTYHVLHHLFSAIGSSMLVNEQMRLLHALSIWISINGSSFKDVTLLRTLILGAINLIAQYDLAHFAQGILEWAFQGYTHLNSLEPKFPDLLGRIARIAHDYSRDVDPALAGLGNDLLDWIEKQAWKLSNSVSIREQILKTLPLWPRRPNGPLAELAQELNQAQPLSNILQNQHVKTGKFRLVRRLRDFADMGLYTKEQFCEKDFWNLKACISSREEIQDEDIDAFIDVLSKSAAQIVPLRDGFDTSRSVANLHQMASWKLVDGRRETPKVVSPHRPIVISLLENLFTDVPSQIYRAYTTLRLIFALSQPDLSTIHEWPQESRKEISYLNSYRLPTVAPPRRSLEELRSFESDSPLDFRSWICEVSLLLNEVLAGDDMFYAQLSSLIRSDPSFASQMLPVLVHGILISQQNSSRTTLSDYFRWILLEDEAPVQCRQMVVEIVLHLRNFVPAKRDQEDPLAYDKWLDIDFRLLSRGAMSCGAYTTALLFLELAADYSKSSPTDLAVEEILYEIYSHIEEPDGFYAIKSNDVRGFLTRRFHHEGQWDKAFQFHGADFSGDFLGRHGAEGILQSLHSNGFDKLAMAVLQSSNPEAGKSIDSSELGYQIAWRTQLWDLPETVGDQASSLYTTLRAVHRNRDPCSVDRILNNALRQEMSRLHATGIEDMVGVRQRSQALVCLREIKRWRDVDLQQKIATQDATLDSWAEFLEISKEFDFATLESVIATRLSLLRSTKQREQREQMGDMESSFVSDLKSLEQKCLLRLSQAARMSEHNQIALNAITQAQHLSRVPAFEVSREFASVLWEQKEHKLAVDYMKGLVYGEANMGTNENMLENARILSQLGAWSAEACLEKPIDIREQYFRRATMLILGDENQEAFTPADPALALVFHQYALFAEDQYHAIMRSPEVTRLRIYAERKKHEIEFIKGRMGATQSQAELNLLTQAHQKAEEIHGNDVAQISVHTETRLTFLIQATEMYSRCLQVSDEFDDSAVIRLCSLWFSNFSDDQIQPDFNRAIQRVPSRKFIFLAHQLSARLSESDTGSEPPRSQTYLKRLVLRMCGEHPFHSLYQVWALQEGTLDTGRRKSVRSSTPTSHTGRARAAAEILATCRLEPHNTERVQSIELLCKAYLEWAKYPLRKQHGQALSQRVEHKMPSGIFLRKISNLPVPVTTAHTPLDHTLEYKNIVTITSYVPTFRLAGGNNLPKINDCIGNDGQKYRQLFKGEGGDDLRQDAVMEQVFELVNIVLKRDRETRKRQLNVRCYKVIPLAPQAGLLEFVQNTMPLGSWLLPAHKRYRPEDIDHGICNNSLRSYREKRNGVIDDPVDMRNMFVSLLLRFRPVFRHFFTERNKLPTAWFATRLMYARSAATTSIVGHILGLGDRHVSNILIDKSTGELVHIDLGIAFDQGKQLKVPELVPFRLTGDMVDGLGTAGTEGVFRRCAEETLRVLRAESGVITTVLEVFRHDPLHSWTASAIKIQRLQGVSAVDAGLSTTSFGLGIDMASDAVDESADRALSSVHHKLDKSLSVEYTVNELIMSATDPTNLAQIFVGWSPCL